MFGDSLPDVLRVVLPEDARDPLGAAESALQLSPQAVLVRGVDQVSHGRKSVLGQRAELGVEVTPHMLREILPGGHEGLKGAFDAL